MADVPPAGKFLPQLDGIRAIAVTMVLLVHIAPPHHGLIAWAVRHTLSNGWIGVDLFFVLSGFLITSILLKEKSEPHYFRNFYMRRALRIFPLFYLVVVILIIAGPRLPFGPAPAVFPFLTYTSNFWMVFSRHEWLPLGHSWSLSVEEQFYLFYPFIVLRLSTRQLRRLMWCVVALSPLVRVVSNALISPTSAAFLTYCFFDVLGAGALIAIEFHDRATIGETAVRRLRIAFVVSLVALLVLWQTKQLNYAKVFFNVAGVTVIAAACALFITLAALERVPFGRWLRHPLPVAIGRISYGIYLLHYPVVKLAEVFATRFGDTWLHTAVVGVIGVGATLPLAVVSWFGFERPVLRLKKFFYTRGDGEARVRAETLDDVSPEVAK